MRVRRPYAVLASIIVFPWVMGVHGQDSPISLGKDKEDNEFTNQIDESPRDLLDQNPETFIDSVPIMQGPSKDDKTVDIHAAIHESIESPDYHDLNRHEDSPTDAQENLHDTNTHPPKHNAAPFSPSGHEEGSDEAILENSHPLSPLKDIIETHDSVNPVIKAESTESDALTNDDDNDPATTNTILSLQLDINNTHADNGTRAQQDDDHTKQETESATDDMVAPVPIVEFTVNAETKNTEPEHVDPNITDHMETLKEKEELFETAPDTRNPKVPNASVDETDMRVDLELPSPTTRDPLVQSAYPQPYCGVWGTCRRNRAVNVSLLFKFFEYDILGNKTEYTFPDPHIEATRITNAAFEKAKDHRGPRTSTRPSELLEELPVDEINLLFEGVDAPDELDVGAGGSSIQEVLMGQGSRIVVTRLKLGLYLVLKALRTLKDSLMARIQDEDGNLNLLSDESIEMARKWAMTTLARIIAVTRRVVDEIRDGNFEGILDAFGSDDDDDFASVDHSRQPVNQNSARSDAYISEPTRVNSQNRHASSATINNGGGRVDSEMEELVRLMGLAPEAAPIKPASIAKSPSSISKSQVANGDRGDRLGEGSPKPAMDKEMDELLRQLGVQ